MSPETQARKIADAMLPRLTAALTPSSREKQRQRRVANACAAVSRAVSRLEIVRKTAAEKPAQRKLEAAAQHLRKVTAP